MRRAVVPPAPGIGASERLICAAMSNPAALGELVELVWAWALAYSAARVHITGRDTAEDVAHDVCVAVLEQLPEYPGQAGQVIAWIYSLTHRRIDAHHHRCHDDDTAPEESIPDTPDPRPGPEQRILLAEQVDRVVAASAHLTEQQRQIVWLRGLGAATADTATILGITEIAVRVGQHRALKHLRAVLTADATTAPLPAHPTLDRPRTGSRQPRRLPAPASVSDWVFAPQHPTGQDVTGAARSTHPILLPVCRQYQALYTTPAQSECVWCSTPDPRQNHGTAQLRTA